MGRSLRPLLLVALGGAVGSVVRWMLVALGPDDATETIVFGINVIGSLLLGVVLGRRERLTDHRRLAIGTGFAGGLTTFAGYAVAVAQSLDDGALLAAGANGLGTPVTALLAAGLGFRAARLFGARPTKGRRRPGGLARATGRAGGRTR